ncbi:MAG: hypothetical protein KME27_29665 [Lyngbya sp. HA4199-MV5]|jgi:hypothetical protein|nr:hypothetical protein [Lyngbya sp. HA4199-MV5]
MFLAEKLREISNFVSKLRVPVLRMASFMFLAYLLFGCSWVTSFVIANQTNSVLDVTYQFRGMATETGSCFDENWRTVPDVFPISDLRKQTPKVQQLSRSEYSCNVKELRVKFPLKPKMAVKVGTEVNYLGHEDSIAYSGHLGIESLKLSGSSDSITYEGLQVIRGFREVDQTLYVLEYN